MGSHGFILTKPVVASVTGGAGYGQKILNAPVAAAATSSIDHLPVSAMASVKWLVTINAPHANRALTYEMVGHYRTGDVEPSWTRYGTVGTPVAHVPSLEFDAQTNTLLFKITNNESHSIAVSVMRVEMSI